MKKLHSFGILLLTIGAVLFLVGYDVSRSLLTEEILINDISIPPNSSKNIPILYKEGRYEFNFTSTQPVNFLSSSFGIEDVLDSENDVTSHESYVQGRNFTLFFLNNGKIESLVSIKMYYIPDIVLLPWFLGIALIIIGIVTLLKGGIISDDIIEKGVIREYLKAFGLIFFVSLIILFSLPSSLGYPLVVFVWLILLIWIIKKKDYSGIFISKGQHYMFRGAKKVEVKPDPESKGDFILISTTQDGKTQTSTRVKEYTIYLGEGWFGTKVASGGKVEMRRGVDTKDKERQQRYLEQLKEKRKEQK